MENRHDSSTGFEGGMGERRSLDSRESNRPEGLTLEIDPASRLVRPAEDAFGPASWVTFGRLAKRCERACHALARLRSRRPVEAHRVGPERPKTLLEFRIDRHMRIVRRVLDQIQELNPRGMTRDELPEDVWDSLAERRERALVDIVDAEVRFWAAIVTQGPMIRLGGNDGVWVGRVVRLAIVIGNSADRRRGDLESLRDWASHEGRASPRVDRNDLCGQEHNSVQGARPEDIDGGTPSRNQRGSIDEERESPTTPTRSP